MNDPLISILMPAHNASQFIVETLESIIEQTFENWELIIVDDFSSDNTFELIEKFVSRDARIIGLQNQDKGIVPALNLAFTKSRGEYITRMDSDDLMVKNKLELFQRQTSSNLREVITGKVKYISNQKISEGYLSYEHWLNSRIEEQDHMNHIYRECVIASPNWMVQRSCFEDDISFEKLSYPEDYDMVLKWYKHGYSIKTIAEITHLWREHPKRTSRNSENYQQKAFFTLKTNHFVDIEKPSKVQLVGSGNKSKLVANILKEKGVEFEQFSFDGKFRDIDELKSDYHTIQTA